MTSAFFGGMADTLLKERQAADAERRETESFKKKQQILLDMQRNEKPDYDRKVWVLYDGNGKEVSTRAMTPSELKDRDLTNRKAESDVRTSELNAEGKEFQVGLDKTYGVKERETGLQASQANIEQSRAGTAASRQSVAASQHRMRLDNEESAERREVKAGEAQDFAASALTTLATTLSTRYEDPRAPQPTTTYSEAAADIQRIVDGPGSAKEKKRAIQGYMGAVISGLPQRLPPATTGNSLDTFGAAPKK